MIEEVDVNVFLSQPRKQMSGEEYFETNPMDNSFELETTNRDLVSGTEYTIDHGYDTAYKMINNCDSEYQTSPIRQAFRDQDVASIKKDLEKEHYEKTQYRRQLYEMKERLHHFERMKTEYEKLYTEFLVKSIKAQRDKQQLEKRIDRMNCILRCLSLFQFNRTCISSWLDPHQYTLKRAIILFGCLLGVTLLISSVIVIL
jgi:hypothetical protein